jgi:hypothetical protein
MKKPLSLLAVLALIVMVAGGCATKSPDANTPSGGESSEHIDNPFEQSGDDDPSGVMGSSIGHGLFEPALDENNERIPLQYSGGEMEIKYHVNASGKGKNVGFLVFLDGIPQPYKIDDHDAPYEYMHLFNIEEDEKDYPFTFIFTPITGKRGEQGNLTFLSVYNPSFRPDMKETVSYGNYHSILPYSSKLDFGENAGELTDTPIPMGVISGNALTYEPVTNDLLEMLSAGTEVTPEIFEDNVFQLIYYNGATTPARNLKVEAVETLKITYKLCGSAGARYRTTFYIDHEPIASADGIYTQTDIKKGEISVVEAELDISALPDFSTFYAVSVPVDASMDYSAMKTSSMLLYK